MFKKYGFVNQKRIQICEFYDIMKNMILSPLDKIGKEDIALAGGKASPLGELMKAGFEVPKGFVILTPLFNSLFKGIELDDFNTIEELKNISASISEIIEKTEIPIAAEAEILETFDELGCAQTIVRSSATTEDSDEASFAGELESYFNKDREELILNIKKCWASLFSPRAIVYRREKGLLKKDIGMAVIVQETIEADYSGIAFTANPLNKKKSEMVIEAGFGLGEAVVMGSITPDMYIVEKETASIKKKMISRQDALQEIGASGDVEWEDVPANNCQKQKLSDKDILRLAETCMDIEKRFGGPQDIEFAFKDGKLYILQSRPITTFKNGKNN